MHRLRAPSYAQDRLAKGSERSRAGRFNVEQQPGTGPESSPRMFRPAYSQLLAQLMPRDPLTGLPDRVLFADRLRSALLQAERYGDRVAVVVIRLTDAPHVRTTYGLAAGDELVRLAAEHLAAFTRASDTLAYLGNDLFAILLPRAGELAAVLGLVQRTMRLFDGHWEVAGHALHLQPAVGIACCPESGSDGETLLLAALSAADAAGADPRRPQVADPAQQEAARARLALEVDLRRALERDELRLVYQPQVGAETGFTSGFEALLRWQQPERGLVLPAQFIALADETRLILPIGAWVIEAACRQLAAWRDEGLPPLRVAVNLSAVQLAEPEIVDTVALAMRTCGIPEGQLEIEITESAALASEERTAGVLEDLRQLGVRLTLDDFGTGYSSASVLTEYTFDTLKIDRSFVTRLPERGRPWALTNAIIAFAHSAGMTVVAEGVETTEQLQALREMGADEIQGYLFARPLEPRDCVPFMTGRCLVPQGPRGEVVCPG